jgi:hypothetical protein
MDELPAACVDADVAETGEEDEVAGPQRATRHVATVSVLRRGVVREIDAEPAVRAVSGD